MKKAKLPPKETKYIVYYRLDTERHKREAIWLAKQKASIASYMLKYHGMLAKGQIISSVCEVARSKDEKPLLAQALKDCRVTGSRLLVASLDRLTPDMDTLISLMGDEKEPIIASCEIPPAVKSYEFRLVAEILMRQQTEKRWEDLHLLHAEFFPPLWWCSLTEK